MKIRILFVFAIASVLLLILTLTVAAQGSEGEGSGQAMTPDRVSSEFVTDLSRGSQNSAGLGYASEITFTPVATSYLPAVFRNDGGCSTIPTLLSPADGSSLNTIAPLYRWDNGNNPSATTLRLQIAENSSFTKTVTSLWSGGTSGVRTFRFSTNLDPATIYYWRTWLICGDIPGPYSEVWSFTTGSGGTNLSAPALVAPANGGTAPATTITLQWSSVPGAIEYLVHWGEVGEGGYYYRWVNGTETTISSLTTNTTYEWWVSARNDYAIGTDSVVWQFTTPAISSSPLSQNMGDNIVTEDRSTSITLEEHNNK